MSLFGSIARGIGGLLGIGRSKAVQAAPVIIQAGGAIARKAPGAIVKAGKRTLPGVGIAAAGAGLAGALSGAGAAPTRRRRGRGFSARDVRQTKRLLKMLKDVHAAAPKPRTTRSSGGHHHHCK